MSRYPDWNSDGADWPNRETSRFVRAGGYDWHVQQAGTGPVCLMLHGTGAATHSWRDLMPLLAKHYTVVALDLPGHGFTKSTAGGKVSLEGMAASVAVLLEQIGLTPDLIVGQVVNIRSRDFDLFQQATIQPVVDFNRLQIVLVIVNFKSVDITPLLPSP